MTYIFIIALIAIVYYYLKNKNKTATAFGKELVYTDSNVANSKGVVVGELLIDQELGISGKPDFIVKSEDGKYIPIEIKSSNIEGNDPYPGDKMQLATYIALTIARFGPVAYGEIHYRNNKFVIQNTPELITELREVVNKMRNYSNTGEKPNALGYSGKCRYCDCRGTVCKVKI